MRPDPSGAAGHLASAATRAAWDFSRIEEFWVQWKPLTPWGRDHKEARAVPAEAAAIEQRLDHIDDWEAFEARVRGTGEAGQARLDRIAWHLGRVPRLPDGLAAGEGSLDLVDLFVTGKFIYNYTEIARLADSGAREAFGLEPAPAAVAALLGAGGADRESFGLSDAYDPRLGALRSRIAAIDATLAESRGSLEARALAEAGIDFAGRDFVLVPLEVFAAAEGSCEELFDLESWDGRSHVLRLRPAHGDLALRDERARLLDEERGIEAEVLGRLSAAVMAGAEDLGRRAVALTLLDLARSRAALCGGGGFCRPEFAPEADPPLVVSGGRLLPLEKRCADTGTAYTALDLELPERAAVIFGSNMGGKTVALETLLFLQILAQCGFRVPARRFASRIHPLVHYVGEGGAEPSAAGEGMKVESSSRVRRAEVAASRSQGGLSGFGREIRSFVESEAWSREGALLAFDEFARTTGSREAEALLSAALEHLAALPGAKCLFSTHFGGVARLPGVRYLRMRGLDREAAVGVDAAAGASATPDSGLGLIARINALMRYQLVEDSGEAVDSDAILIAGLLGLDASIVGRAADYYAPARGGRRGSGA